MSRKNAYISSILYFLVVLSSSVVSGNVNLTNWSRKNTSKCAEPVLCKCLDGNVFKIIDDACYHRDVCSVRMDDHCSGPAPLKSQCSYYNPHSPKGLPNVTSVKLNMDLIEPREQPVEIPCTIKSNPPACVKWLFNGSSIEKLKESNFYGSTPNPYIDFSPPKSTLTLYNIKRRLHRGQYTCVATNAIGQANYTFDVRVEVTKKRKPLPVINCNEKNTAYLGASFNITCSVIFQTSGMISADFRRDNNRVEDDSRHERYQLKHSTFVMIITNVSYEDAGVWQLYAFQSGFKQIQSTELLVVPCPRGSYCPLNESTPRQCPPRTYNDGKTNITYSCQACPDVASYEKVLRDGAKSIEECPTSAHGNYSSQDNVTFKWYYILIILICVMVLLGLVACLIIYTYKKYKKYNRRNIVMNPYQAFNDDTELADMEIIYDVFLSFSEIDHQFGKTLQSTIEEQGYKCCFHYRDFLPGVPIVENITDAIYKSKVTLVVLSPNYNESRFCKRELRQALTAAEVQRRVLPVLYNTNRCPPEVRSCLTYLEFKPDHERQFWSKLLSTLKTFCDKGLNCDSQV